MVDSLLCPRISTARIERASPYKPQPDIDAMKAIINNISNWVPIHPQQRMEDLQKNDRKRNVAHYVIGKELSLLDLYVYLKTRFGPPNGIQMALRSPSSDNLIHWHYTIKASDSVVLEIWQTNLTADIFVEGIVPAHADWDHLISAIKADFKAHGPSMSKVRKDLERWHLFVNPYKRLHDLLDKCLADLKSLDIQSVTIPETPLTPAELRNFSETISSEQVRFKDAFRLGVTIRMLAPVLGEAFINLVIFLLAKPDIKRDRRLYQDTIKRDIDVRVKSLHVNCVGFEKPVDATSNAFKEFHSLMNNRNDFLHGNVDPTKLKYDTVYFDYRTVPIFERRATFGELALSDQLIHVEPEKAKADLDTVSTFIDLVLESLETAHRDMVKAFMSTSSPGWRPKDGRAGILFSEYVVHSVPGNADST